ncbi:MAG: (2Fe-2S)-binding protein [Pseudomonadota bacterium]
MNKENNAVRLQEGVARGKPLEIIVDGAAIPAYQGETIAAALLGAGVFVSGTRDDRPRGVFCNIGVCHSCVMTVNGVSNVRICRTLVSEGCRVESRHFKKGGGDDGTI